MLSVGRFRWQDKCDAARAVQLAPYSWDAENRLTSLEEKTSTRQPPAQMVRQRLEFRYDAGGRRTAKKVIHAEGNGNFVLNQRLAF